MRMYLAIACLCLTVTACKSTSRNEVSLQSEWVQADYLSDGDCTVILETFLVDLSVLNDPFCSCSVNRFRRDFHYVACLKAIGILGVTIPTDFSFTLEPPMHDSDFAAQFDPYRIGPRGNDDQKDK